MAANVIDASADFLRDTKRMVVAPIVHFLMGVVIFILWLTCFACVVSMNDIKASTKIPQLKSLTWTWSNFWLAFLMVFYLFWLLTCVENLSNMVVMITASTYYFNNDAETAKDEASQKPAEVCTGWTVTYCSHIGTVAVGSLLIAIMRLIKWTFVAIAHKIETMGGDNGFVRCMVGCAMCLIQCLETIVEYLTEAAFCYIAVTGDNFFYGAYNAFLLNLRHLAEFWWTHALAKFFMFISKVAVICGNCALYYFVLVPLMIGEKHTSWGPLIIVGVASYLMVSIFVGMYDVAADAILTSYAIDCEVNGGENLYGPETFFDGKFQE